MLIREIRQALRSLLQSPGFTAVAVLTLGLGIGADAAIFSVVDAVLLEPLPYPDAERLVVLWESNPQQGLPEEQVSAATYLDWRQRSTAFAAMAAYSYRGFTLTGGDEPERIDSLVASPQLFDVLGVEPALGRAFRPEEETPGNERVVILSHGLWARRFGAGEGVIGSTISLDGEPHEIVGVMPAGFEFPPDDAGVEVWSPLTLSYDDLPTRPHRLHFVIGRLRPGVELAAARAEMDRIAAGIAEENPASNGGWGVRLVPAREQMVGAYRTTLWVLLGAVGFVLLIACANIASLLLVRASGRQKEIAIRGAMGAGRWRLVRLSLTESLVLGAFGGVVGVVFAFWGLDLLLAFLPADVPRLRGIGIDGSVLGFAAALSLGSAAVFGLVPALRVIGADVAEVLKEGGRAGGAGGRGARRVLDSMVATEVALALVLLAGAGLMVRSFARLLEVDPGFRTEGLVAVAVSLPPTKYPGRHEQVAFFHELVDRVEQLPGVLSAGAVTALPLSAVGRDFDLPFEIVGRDLSALGQQPRADYRAVAGDYFRALGIPLVAGRLLDRFDREDGRRVMLVNETFVRRYFGNDDPLGEIAGVPMAGQLEIVGVVGDVHHYGLERGARPEMFVPYQQFPLRDMNLVVHGRDDVATLVGRLEEQVWSIDPEQPVSSVRTVEELLARSVAQRRFNTFLLVGLAACALVLAAVGIYGVISYSVAQRRAEIGVRMALGAGSADTVRLMVGQSAGFVVAGIVVGVAGAYALRRLVAGLLYGTSATDPGTLAAVVLLLAAVALVASWVPARRAARVDPVKVLRQE